MFTKNLTKWSTTTTSNFHQNFMPHWMKPAKLLSNPTITSCPAQCPTANDVPDGVVDSVGKKIRTDSTGSSSQRGVRAYSHQTPHQSSKRVLQLKRCSSVQKQSLAKQDVTDERDKVIDQIVSLKNQTGTTTSNIFPKDGAIHFTLNVTQAVDCNKTFDNDVATDQPIDGSSWMRLFTDCLFGRIPSNLCGVSSCPA
ncbi:unnamed protein product [Clavelina lepadiformis]|uniref:Uncharacterized protein n=1 Tax=Clavelina lepadiformis TaxID=159417 RepID=A0ABP0GJ14_CLALP